MAELSLRTATPPQTKRPPTTNQGTTPTAKRQPTTGANVVALSKDADMLTLIANGASIDTLRANGPLLYEAFR